MAVLLALGTISVIGALIVLQPSLRGKRTGRSDSTARILEHPSDGLARVPLPDHWEPQAFLPYGAPLQAVDPVHHRFCLVISEPREAFGAGMDLVHHSARTLEFVTRSAAVVALRGPNHRQVGGFHALQYEVEALDDRNPLTYLHTTIAGRRAFHQVLCWSTLSTYDRGAFERLLDAFEESEGSGSTTLPESLPVYAEQSSAYEVH